LGVQHSIEVNVAQHALAPDAAPLRFAAQVKRRPLGSRSLDFSRTLKFWSVGRWSCPHKALPAVSALGVWVLWLAALARKPCPVGFFVMPAGWFCQVFHRLAGFGRVSGGFFGHVPFARRCLGSAHFSKSATLARRQENRFRVG